MTEIGTEELKKIQLDILDYFNTFCEEHSINYWLDSGTLIGAVRHGGLIPWDDDIDIGVLRADFERIRTLFNNNGRYKFITVENEPALFCPYGKIVDSNTILVEDEKYLLSINIDVMVYDNAPDDKNKIDKIIKKRELLRKYYALKKQKGSLGTGIAGVIKRARRRVLNFTKDGYFIKRMVKNATRYEGCTTQKAGDFSSYEKRIVNRNALSKTIKVKFEDRMYPIPVCYDELLTLEYGDYMTPPPENERTTKHNFRAYYAADFDYAENSDLIVMDYIKAKK